MVGNKHVIIGIHIRDRMHDAPSIQELFSHYGCYIKTRIGLHEVSDDFCAPDGVILLEMYGDPLVVEEFKLKMEAWPGVDVREMVFDHPSTS